MNEVASSIMMFIPSFMKLRHFFSKIIKKNRLTRKDPMLVYSYELRTNRVNCIPAHGEWHSDRITSSFSHMTSED